MKFSVWLLLLFTFTLPAKAQLQSGGFLVGAELNQLNYEKIAVNTITSKVLLTPSFSYCLGQNLVISLGVPLGVSSSSYGYGTGSPSNLSYGETQTRVGLSPSIRYYLGRSNLKPFLSFSYSYLVNRNTYTLVNDRYSANDQSTMFVPSIGIAYCFTRKLVLMTSLNYLIDTNNSDNLIIAGPTTSLDVARPNSKSLSMGFGIQVFLGK